MKDISWKHIHFIGIGGAGMSGLALIAKEFGIEVTGTDIAASYNTEMLEKKAISVKIGHQISDIHNADLVVYSSAIDITNIELKYVIKNNIHIQCRGKFLSEIARLFPITVAIAGSHGKTTVASILSHILIQNDLNPGYLIGGTVINRKDYATSGNKEILIIEVDESDGSFTNLKSSHAIIINIDDDHFWNVGGKDYLWRNFTKFANASDYLLCYNSAICRKLMANHSNVNFFSDSQIIDDLTFILPGMHNRLNASLAIHIAEEFGIKNEYAINSLKSFKGVDRRLSVRYDKKDILIIEDYAHHPTEIRESILAIKEKFPNRKQRVIFQPHRYERINHYCKDFAKELSKVDEVFIIPPFNAWINDQNIADPRKIVKEITKIPAYYKDCSILDLVKQILSNIQKGDIITVMGAGDITNIIPHLISKLKSL